MVNNKIYEVLNYTFNNEELIETALTHKSIHQDIGYIKNDNERLEFIGDALLDAIIGIELFRLLPKEKEGTLTKKRALIVCERSLASVARKLELGKYMKLSSQAISNNVNEKDSVLADLVEAIIGAIYLDSDYETAKKFILDKLNDTVVKAIKGEIFSDYKSELQEYFQSKRKNISLKYVVDKEEGPAHNKTFYVHVEESDIIYGYGVGSSKKIAEQNAAKESLLFLKKEIE